MNLGSYDASRSRVTFRSSSLRSGFFGNHINYWIVLFAAILWVVLYRHFVFASAHDPTSYFFNPATGYQRSYSLVREHEAYAYIKKSNFTGSTSQKSSASPSLCVGVATVARGSKEQYVRGTIGSLLEGLSDIERANIHLTTFIANTNASIHPIYHEPWVYAVSDRVLTYESSEISKIDIALLHKFEEEHDFRNKSMYDYGFLLNDCLTTGAKWIAIIEDDAIARAGWYTTAIKSLERIEEQVAKPDWLYLRLFYTESLLGWNSEEWPRYLGWSIFIFLSLLSALILLRPRSPVLRRHVSDVDIAGLCCVDLPAFIALYFMAGRMTMQPLSPGVRPMSQFGCCSQGFVFPREIVSRAIERTRQAMYEDLFIDMLFERWADKEGLARFATFPSLLQHVGVRSSKGWGYDQDAGMTWNFAFESIRP